MSEEMSETSAQEKFAVELELHLSTWGPNCGAPLAVYRGHLEKLLKLKSEYHILNLGVGVQSTTLYLMFMRGELKPQIDCAIFADTQEEPSAVYRHLEWLQSLNGPPILIRTVGKLGDDLINGKRGHQCATCK